MEKDLIEYIAKSLVDDPASSSKDGKRCSLEILD